MPVHVERCEGIAFLTLDQPQRRNSFDLSMAIALRDAVRGLALAPPKVVLLRSRGEHFSVGGDVHHFQQLLQRSPDARSAGVAQLVGAVNEAVLGLTDLPCPVLGLLNGAVAGFGLSLALGCDLLVAAEDARLVYAYGAIGITPDGGGSWHLPRHLGLPRALALALLNRPLSAQQAQALGLVVDVVSADALPATGLALARRLAGAAAAAQTGAKRLLRAGLEGDLASALDRERGVFVSLCASDDFAEGVEAFCERRPASFG
ncbi:enoyl-CoA hydratase-related protein [Pseudomonas mosselii]|uniref:enoyl-CoA hydratase/isomerase family protein n=1 Tax=Pseudomonas mosselii TaxID=78327 RepID=UPI00076FE17F|nr:enoyl-CoA hydratase-related protein [Pseudomonas mosselii]AMK30715.1 Enoyl-CoA hydratase [Pseudomonas putida]MDH1715332.1 enoyl-CoA hydratase-related protein [Pseudomonas mosselii]MDH1720023.1 enoyl-CoA hydratase-related protein [Pseudomonas mosselii]MDN4497508.1 enoyl-CoA hydratase-related protein [Pseudomonas mosselii]ORT66542.1 enoyl-CoA hydratase [Pseudomonas mosselii]